MNIRKHIKKYVEWICVFFIFALAFLFSLRCSTTIFKVGNMGADSAVFRYVAKVMLNGGMPYRDAVDHKGPLLYLLNVIGMTISEFKGVWWMELATFFGTFYLIYKIARMRCGKLSSLAVLLISSAPLFHYLGSGNYTEEYAMPFIAVSIYIFADYFLNKKVSDFRLLVCGFSFGAVCLLRANMAVVWLVMCAGVLADHIYNYISKNDDKDENKREKARELFRKTGKQISLFIVGAALMIAPVLLWLAVNHALKDFWEQYIVFNSQYIGDTTFAKQIKVFVDSANTPYILCSFLISVYFAVKKRKNFDILYVIFMLLSLITVSVSGRLYQRYSLILIPAFAYPFSLLGNQLDFHLASNSSERRNYAASLITLYFVVILALPLWITALPLPFEQFPNRNKTSFGAAETRTARVIQENTSPDDRILVVGNWDVIYLLSNRFCSSVQSFQSPLHSISPELKSRFWEEMKDAVPPSIVVYNESQLAFTKDELTDYLEKNHYMEIDSFNGSVHGNNTKIHICKPGVAAPELKNASADVNGITVEWNAVPDITEYRIYRKEAKPNEHWDFLANVSETRYIDKEAVKGVVYLYTVRCVRDGSLISGYDPDGIGAESVSDYYATPELKSATADSDGITVKWNAVPDITEYRIYRKEAKPGEHWAFLADVADTRYIDQNAAKSMNYIYTVRCLKDGVVMSGYNPDGIGSFS